MTNRSVVLMAFVVGLAFARGASGPALAQGTNTGGATAGQTAPALEQAAARVKYLHDRLRITAEQEPHWNAVAQAIRDNAGDLAPLLKERFQATTSGSALDLLHSYETLGEAQLDGLKKIITVFDPLYDALSDSQKKIADAIIREGAERDDQRHPVGPATLQSFARVPIVLGWPPLRGPSPFGLPPLHWATFARRTFRQISSVTAA